MVRAHWLMVVVGLLALIWAGCSEQGRQKQAVANATTGPQAISDAPSRYAAPTPAAEPATEELLMESIELPATAPVMGAYGGTAAVDKPREDEGIGPGR